MASEAERSHGQYRPVIVSLLRGFEQPTSTDTPATFGLFQL